MASPDLINKSKLALKITTDDFDSEIACLIDAAMDDLGIAGVTNRVSTEPLIARAVITYCRANWGSPSDYDRLKASYDEQKAQLSMSADFTDFGDV